MLNRTRPSHWPLQEKLSEQLEEQRQEQALQRYHSEAEELDHWLLSTRATLSSALQPLNEDLDMEEQLIDCQVRFLLSSKAGLIDCLSTERFRVWFIIILPRMTVLPMVDDASCCSPDMWRFFKFPSTDTVKENFSIATTALGAVWKSECCCFVKRELSKAKLKYLAASLFQK